MTSLLFIMHVCLKVKNLAASRPHGRRIIASLGRSRLHSASRPIAMALRNQWRGFNCLSKHSLQTTLPKNKLALVCFPHLSHGRDLPSYLKDCLSLSNACSCVYCPKSGILVCDLHALSRHSKFINFSVLSLVCRYATVVTL